ncbi:Crp/Fnr family transcriptional regulator [Litorilituus sediminis]|uniref:Crp/Fnr family transcriptional regulator n=1 Tax=Litorilituus sediminis TaxID=718192 RepID=A0A4P6P3Q4_9GAMM|nr:Crp/Fnr family transcriptional regulator [Litorilituus sediminis]QBG35458.1 Crp/Fnr family transcriptional regulator [Litorilituus sediminis]
MPNSINNCTTLLQLLNTEQRELIEQQSTQIELAAGDCLFNKGDSADNIFLVKKGKVTLYRLMPNGEQKVFKVFMSGGVIAEMAVFMQPRQYPMSAHIDQASSIVCYSYQSFTKLFTSYPELALNVISFISNRVGQLMNSMDMLTQVNANQRLVMHFAEIYQKQKRQDNRFTLPNTKKVLASQLGITPETLSRLFNKLKFNGLIKESGACITVPDINGLCREVDLVPDIFHN